MQGLIFCTLSLTKRFANINLLISFYKIKVPCKVEVNLI